MTDHFTCHGCGKPVLDDDTIIRTANGIVWHFRCHTVPDYRASAPPTIDYTITPKRFILDIPVEALANLTPDAHTRMLAMLNNWITENKPVVVKGATRPASDAVPATGGDGLGSGGVVGTGLGAK